MTLLEFLPFSNRHLRRGRLFLKTLFKAGLRSGFQRLNSKKTFHSRRFCNTNHPEKQICRNLFIRTDDQYFFLAVVADQFPAELFDSDLYNEISLETCVEKRISEGGTSVASVEAQIAAVRKELAE